MSKSWTSPPHAVNLRQFFDNIYNLKLLRNFPVSSRRRSCSRYRKIFPAYKNVKYQYGQGAKCSSTNTGVFHSQACTFPEESFILSSPCNSECFRGFRFKTYWDSSCNLCKKKFSLFQNVGMLFHFF